MKDKTMAAIRNYRDLSNRMSGELHKIDPDLREDAKKKREDQVREKYNQHLTANIAKIREGREYFTQARLKAADSFRALMLKTFRSDVSAGMQAAIEGLSLMSAEQQLEFAQEIRHPALTLRAITNIRMADLDPQTRANLATKVQELSKTYIDQKEIRENAEIEKACLEAESLANQNSGGSPQDRAAIGYRLSALKRVIDTGEVSDKELAEALAKTDPVERMQAARKAG